MQTKLVFKCHKFYKHAMSRSKNNFTLSNAQLEFITKSFPRSIVAIDLETTGLSPLSDKIIEIAAIKIENKKIHTFHQLINPEILIPEFTTKIHGITDEDVQAMPNIKSIMPGLLEFIGDSAIVAHNALFDVGFLAKEISFNKLSFSPNKVYDSCKITRYLFKRSNAELKPANFRLSTLCDFFSFPLNHHQAMDDAWASLLLFAKSLELAQKEKIKDALEKSFLFQLDFFTKYKHQELSKEAKSLLDIITDRAAEPTYIVYSGGTLADTPRKIRPIGLLPWPKGPVLYAQCLESNMNKSFIVKKITKVMTNNEYEERYGKK